MSFEILAQTLVSGLLIGSVYSLIAIGLTLIYGVMDMVNFAHGAYLMLAMFTAYWLNVLMGWDPLVSLPVCALLLYGVGVGTYRLLIKRVLAAPTVAQIFATFGLMVFMENSAQFLWNPDYRLVENTIVKGNIALAGVHFSIPKLVAALGCVLTTAAIFWFISKTRTGRALQATAINKDAAKLMGIDTDKMFRITWGLGGACVGVAGALLSTFYYVFPEVGGVFNLLAFVVVALGGFGSVMGAFYAGLLIGVIENVAGILIGPAFKYAVVFFIFVLVVTLRPQGLMGR